MKIFHVNALKNVKGIESKIKSFSSFFFSMLLYLTFKKILKIEIVWRGGGMDLLRLYPWFRLLSKSDHGVDFGGKLKVIFDRLSQSVAPAQSNHI